MCGIAGIWGETNEAKVQTMVDKQGHRGPDGRGMCVQEAGVLGHGRLAIMDPERGTQPMRTEDGSAALVANGMVYNHESLRRQLFDHHEFGSASDSETILHLFEERGLATPRLLDGMFAFAIGSGRRLMLARDPVGIKPLYWARQPAPSGRRTIYFASELKALADLKEKVEEFPPGAVYDSETGLRTYYVVPDRAPLELELATHLHRVRASVEAAVEKRLLSDVPLGVFLSGGLDSSILAAVASQHMPGLPTFAVGIEGSRDLEAARLVADHIGSTHHEYIYSPEEVLEKLPEIVFYLESFDRDLVRSAIPTYFCARLAASEVKVVLTGEGADELFAGYDYHKDIREYDTLRRELRRSINSLHDVNLQRVDRMTMRHGIEGRVPFLDTEVIAVAQAVPPQFKLRTEVNGERVEKWVLRMAFGDLLPHEILWRPKEQFDEGSGTVNLLPALVDRTAGSMDVDAYVEHHAGDRLRSREECLYHRLLAGQFERPRAVLDNVGRWRGGPGPVRSARA